MPEQNLLPSKVVDYISVTSIALEKAAEETTVKEAQEAKIASLIPAAVDALIAGERITEDQREKAAQLLSDPVQTIELLTKVATHSNASERSLGTPVDSTTKQASAADSGYNSITDCRPGMRTTMEKQSDLAFKRGLNVA
jgi:hypothetical protein